MPPKARVPAPIDRPLSRAYLRQFSGWSTAYPPGLSEPTSLRIMENVSVERDGSVGVRPGLRYMSYAEPPTEVDGVVTPGTAFDQPIVGTHEAFFLNDGTKAYLFAVREDDGTVGFRVLVLSDTNGVVRGLTDAGIDFEIPQGEAQLSFTAETTYVKYLQIDNKIFALSNAGETMRLFTVGETKSARRLSSIERPDWSVADKLSVVEPDASWITTGVLLATRRNLVTSPSFELGHNWLPGSNTALSVVTPPLPAPRGTKALRVESLPQRTNLMVSPVHNTAVDGVGTWYNTTNAYYVEPGAGGAARLVGEDFLGGSQRYYGISGYCSVKAGTAYKLALDFTAYTGISNYGAILRFYNSSHVQVGADTNVNWTPAVTRRVLGPVTAPAGAVYARVLVYGVTPPAGVEHTEVLFKNVMLAKSTESTNFFDGASGAGYSWTGVPNASASVYHPATLAIVRSPRMPVAALLDYAANLKTLSSEDDTVEFIVNWFGAGSLDLGSDDAPFFTDETGWTDAPLTATAPASAVEAELMLVYPALARGSYRYVDAVQFIQETAVGTYFDGDTPDTALFKRDWKGTPGFSESTELEYAVGGSAPPAETPTADTLISSTTDDNVYNFGFFYTASNEIGESAASQITVVRAQRSWAGWRWETPNLAGEPSGTRTEDPTLCADQLVATVPVEVFDAIVAQGAVEWSLYMLTWSDQDPVPVEGVLVDKRVLPLDADHGTYGWGRVTPQFSVATDTAPLPKENTRHNYSDPSRAGQGLVAADRMVLVHDPVAAAVIRWTSNQQGEYTNFTASKGGGYKTLTSGNLFIPACVKLWQNPQSADTLTILCQGTDGHSTGYYMAPAQVASQSDATNIMGFEETTATPGTTSPYGCEVLNNALYHPLDEQLMKSVASNYNINHSSQTDQILEEWVGLLDKENIVSSQHDNRLYLIVHNPKGETLLPGCMGNEIWVYDVSGKTGTWSRWLVQAHSLRKIEMGGRTYMSVVRPGGLFYFDPRYDRDDVVGDDLEVGTEFIAWKFETNTQGANRAHDAWCHLQQLQIMVGNFTGIMRFGIHAWDINGKPVEIFKLTRDGNPPSDDELPFDLEDYLAIRKQLKEWFLFAESVTDDEGAVLPSTGQVSYVQYRYAPISVNVGYEYGSVETFEYGRAGEPTATTDNGVPTPFIDTRRP